MSKVNCYFDTKQKARHRQRRYRRRVTDRDVMRLRTRSFPERVSTTEGSTATSMDSADITLKDRGNALYIFL